MTTVRLPLLFDATRLLSRAHFSTPTGIDRVDLAYAQALRSAKDIDAQLIAFDALGPYRLRDAAADQLITRTARRWQTVTPQRSAIFGAIQNWLTALPGPPAPVVPIRKTLPLPDLAALRRLRHRLGAVQNVGAPHAGYVNTSHGGLFRPAVARWLAQRPAKGVFFVHDLIPIEYPHYNRPGENARHATRLRLIARHARCVIVNSKATQEVLLRWWQDQQLPQPPIVVIPLGVAEVFRQTDIVPSLSTSVPYFVTLGTIEPRKNHALLLRLWQQMLASGASPMPRLLVIGRRGWENAAVFDVLDHTPVLRPWVGEVSGLSDSEVAQLLRGARALLAPSFAEGYGLPVVEALAAGIPVIASDLPAHREIGGPWIHLLDSHDDAAWATTIDEYTAAGSPIRAAKTAALADCRSLTWPDHAAMAIEAIRGVTI